MALTATVAAVMALALPAYAHTQISHGKCLAGGGVPVTIAFKGTCVGGDFNGQPIDNPTDAAPTGLP